MENERRYRSDNAKCRFRIWRFRMSIFYFILRLFVLDDCEGNAVVNALLCISDALWTMLLGRICGWW